MIATMKGDAVIVKELLDEGADVNTKDYYGGTILISAAAGGYLDTVKVLLDKGADINAKCYWPGEIMTALMWAVKRSHFKIVKLLKQAEFKTNAQESLRKNKILIKITN